jgi:hypothetical protein
MSDVICSALVCFVDCLQFFYGGSGKPHWQGVGDRQRPYEFDYRTASGRTLPVKCLALSYFVNLQSMLLESSLAI